MASSTQQLFQGQTTTEGKRQRTRSALLDSAISVIASKGFEATKITDVTNHAGVANGTFYLHFKDKDALIRSIANGLAQEITRQIDERLVFVEAADARVTLGTYRIMTLADREHEWIDVLFASTEFIPEAKLNLVRFLKADLERGAGQGLFSVEVDSLLINQIIALVRTGILAKDDQIDPEIARVKTCESILQLLGYSQAKARRTVARVIRTEVDSVAE